MTAQDLLNQLSPKEKIALCEGGDFWHTLALPQHKLGSVMMSDGPHGLRKQEAGQNDMIGINESLPATCFPTAAALGCSWDSDLVHSVGKAICREARAQGVALVLGPGLNIKRNPLCGRNFEYYSEDPHLSGRLAAAFVKGGQSTGVGCCLKHFAANSQEYKRFSSDSVMDERSLREIYLAGFEFAVKHSQPQAVMCSYNKINGTYLSDDKRLLTDILRDEWGFGGLVVTDWGALNDRVAAFKAGCDLNMPGGSKYQQKKALKALKNGSLSQADLDASALRVLDFVLRHQDVTPLPCDLDAHHDLAQKAAEQSAVLLKNEGALPIKGSACLIGAMAASLRYQGAGSSHINPTRLVHPRDCLDWPYAPGYLDDGSTSASLLTEAAALARSVDTPVVLAGLPDSYESEGFDRSHMRLPEGHNQLIEFVCAANPNTVVVLLGGGAMETPWMNQVKAVLYLALPGQAGGQAIANLLTGIANPSGKLAESWPLVYEDVASAQTYGGKDAPYREGVFVGYRHYDAAGKQVRFPFGFGLSYTSFSYADLRLEGDTVSVSIQNTGPVPGAEVAQLYVRPPKGGLCLPAKELRGFQKVFLQPGEVQRVSFQLTDRDFALWQDGWVVPGGQYTLDIGGLTVGIYKEGVPLPAPSWQQGSWYETLEGNPSHQEWVAMLGRDVTPEPVIKGQFTMNNTILEMKDQSMVMRLLGKIVKLIIRRGLPGKVDENDATYRMMMASSLDSALRNLSINSGIRDTIIEGLLMMANGRWLRGIKLMMLG